MENNLTIVTKHDKKSQVRRFGKPDEHIPWVRLWPAGRMMDKPNYSKEG